MVLAVALLCGAELQPGPEAVDDDCRYIEVTISGRLIDPETEQPMADAVVWFTPFDEEGPKRRAQTNTDGRFRVTGLSCSTYLIGIETAEGELIRGINNFEVSRLKDESIEMRFEISDRYQGETSLGIQQERWVGFQEVKRTNWKRFWKQFAIFFGAAAVAGAAAN
jgi:hypothetical protein